MLNQLDALKQEIIDLRRYFHMNPEVSFKEEKTAAYIAEYLGKLGNMEIRTNVGGNGIIADIKGKEPGKMVALRADFDALPLPDEKDVPYKSKVEGVMHACGHDGHTASLLGIAKVLSQNTDAFKGTVRLIFQHAEESLPGGAIAMVEAGCMDGVDAVFGSHLNSQVPVGEFTYAHGPFMASPDTFYLTIQGKGGHGAAPHETVDAIIVAANAVIALQQIASRKVNPLDPVVVTVGTFNAGQAMNIIADSCQISGTVRTFNNKLKEQVIEEMHRILKGTCEAFGATYKLDYIWGYPAVINEAKSTDLAVENLSKLVDADKVCAVEPSMGGEDFAYFLQKAPGCYFNTGAGNVEKGIVYPHHHPKFDIDEDSLLYASKGLLAVALDYLSK